MYSNGGGNYNSGKDYTNIGGFRIKSLYLYAGVAVLVLLGLYFVTRFLNTSLVLHFSAFAGVLLLLANLRELFGQAYSLRSNTSLLNCMIGAALICAWLSQIVSILLWIPAVALIIIATPLALGRASVYSTYVQTARSAVNGVRRTMGR